MTAPSSPTVSQPEPEATAGTPLTEQSTQPLGEATVARPDTSPVADRFRIAPDVIAQIAADAALSVPGAYALVDQPATPLGRLFRRLFSPMPALVPGVNVHATTQDVVLRMFLVVESGAIIPTVATAVRSAVIAQVENLTGLSVRSITIEVCGLHSDEPTQAPVTMPTPPPAARE